MKKRLSILFILFTLCLAQLLSADTIFDKELQEFVKLVKDNAGWYFYEWNNGVYMDMYYIDIGFKPKESLYYIESQCYNMSSFKERK